MASGMLTPHEQLRVLARIWGRDRDGFVFLPWISGTARTKEERRAKYHEGRAYDWPIQEDEILQFLQTHQNDDVYFTPCLFNKERRVENYADAERTLWADLDEVSPETDCESVGKPTIAWETSPGRYQGIWLLDKVRQGASWGGKENHKLTVALGADPSGWDTTQLLRVPGRKNYKPTYASDRRKNGIESRGLLWDNGPRYVWSDFDDLPEVSAAWSSVDDEMADEEFIKSVDRQDVWGRVRLKVSRQVREYMAVRDESAIGDADRSDVLWQIERDLADQGCTVAEIIAIVRPTIWNKYAGRNDELRRLKIEAMKARDVKQPKTKNNGALEGVEEQPKPDVQDLYSFFQRHIPRPRWLIKDIWAQGSVGFISGMPKSYKSWVGIDLAVSVATGTKFLGQFQSTPRGSVLYIQEEDSNVMVRDRISSVFAGKTFGSDESYRDAGGTLSVAHGRNEGPLSVYWTPPSQRAIASMQKFKLYVQNGLQLSDPGWQAWLDDTLAAMGDCCLVVIDTLGTTAGDVDQDRAAEIGPRVLAPLKVLANKWNAAVAVIHHNRKASTEQKGEGVRGYQMLGSVAIHAWVENSLYLVKTEDRDVTVPVQMDPAGDRVENRPGSKVIISTESKFVSSEVMTMRVPTMGEDVFWEPVVEEWQPAEAKSTKESVSVRGSGAGKKIALTLKQVGKGKTVDDLEQITGISAGAIKKQLADGIKNGYVVEADGKYMANL